MQKGGHHLIAVGVEEGVCVAAAQVPRHRLVAQWAVVSQECFWVNNSRESRRLKFSDPCLSERVSLLKGEKAKGTKGTRLPVAHLVPLGKLEKGTLPQHTSLPSVKNCHNIFAKTST